MFLKEGKDIQIKKKLEIKVIIVNSFKRNKIFRNFILFIIEFFGDKRFVY